MIISDILNKSDIVSGHEFASLKFSAPKDDSRTVSKNDVFFATSKGAEYMHSAYLNGAVCVVCEEPPNNHKRFQIPVIQVKNVRSSFAVACQKFRGFPADKLKVIAVTGTNGKTSTSMLIKHILECSGHKTAVVSTIGNYIGAVRYDTSYTTPPPQLLSEFLSLASDANAEYAVIEASSHALDQYRLGGISPDVAVFTNISRDHLDYHSSLDDVAAAKSRLFDISRRSVINLDDNYAKEMAWHSKEVWYCSALDKDAEFFASNISCNMSNVSYTLSSVGKITNISVPITGSFYVYNTMLAFAAASLVGVDHDAISSSLSSFSFVNGRMETIKFDNKTVVVDYAHTPDALNTALSFLKPMCRGKLTVVFGCGGNRDRGKRPEMGKIASLIADNIILTSDNPRTEDKMMIINDIANGIENNTPTLKIPDRAEAISTALEIATDNDIILIAGKGHETYIEDSFGKHYFSDKEQVKEFIDKGSKKCISE